MKYRWNPYFPDIATPAIKRFMDGQITEDELIEHIESW